MLQRIALKSSSQHQAFAAPFESEEPTPAENQTNRTSASLYTLTVLLRVGVVAAILLRALTFWQ